MQRGEVWWVEFDERRPVVLLSGDDGSGYRAVQVVEAADVSIAGMAVEVPVGAAEGLPFEGVLRFAFPRPGYTPCTWLTTLFGDDLIEQAGALPAAKVAEIEDAIRLCEQPRAWTPDTAAQFNEIRNALRAGPSRLGARGFRRLSVKVLFILLAEGRFACVPRPVGDAIDRFLVHVGYAIDVAYWGRWRRRQVRVPVGGGGDRCRGAMGSRGAGAWG